MKIRLTRLVPSLLLLLSLYIGIYLTRGESGWLVKVKSLEAEAQIKSQSSEKNKASYNLQELTILNRVVVYVEENYVEPKRVNRRKMIGAALEEIQRVVPEFMVHVKEDKEKNPTEVEIRVNEHRETFLLDQVKNRYHLIFAFKDIFRFVQRHLKHFEDLREIEYAAVNGMLSTLDPHSILLTPSEYAEMRLSTRGRFGGLGIVVGIRENQLTVLNPIEDTPASKAGLQANDQIVQINLDSTVNMSLSDAVDMMRGDPGSNIDIYIMREGWNSPKKFTLTRANIKVKSVKWMYLGAGVGMVRVRNFQNTTVNELKNALKTLKKQAKRKRLRGLVLDLRGNPGGLLDQAAKMVDLFIEEGTIVKTVGFGDKVREPKMASKRGTLNTLPIVVLVNSSSASASEIVAGALKNHERALIMGQRTFGKGSVQLLFDNPDESALKLTIAQYLTPGDISIQSVGITPTIELSPILLTDEKTYFYGIPKEKTGEASLPEHLENERSAISKTQKPLMKLYYLQDPNFLKEQREKPNEIILDFEANFAKTILLKSRSAQFKQLIRAAETAIAQERSTQETEIDQRLKKKGIQWQSKVSKSLSKGVATVELKPQGYVIRAGETLEMKITVKNTSRYALHKLRGITSSENYLFKGHEFLFGYIPSGESRSWSTKIKVDPSSLSRLDEVKVMFKGEGRGVVNDLRFKMKIEALDDPHFALRYEIDDKKFGNGDGLLSSGEEAEMVLSFMNQGLGSSRELIGHLSNEGKGVKPGLFIKRGRVLPSVQVLQPQDEGSLRFRFKVKEDWSTPEVSTYLTLIDPKLKENSSDKVKLAIHSSKHLKLKQHYLKAKGQADHIPSSFMDKLIKRQDQDLENIQGLYVQPSDHALVASYLSTTKADGCIINEKLPSSPCTWYRIPTLSGRFYWARAIDFKVVEEEIVEDPLKQSIYVLSPPRLTLIPSVPETKKSSTVITGTALSITPLQDLIIYVNNRKVFFLPREEMKDPKGVTFDALVPLEVGVNRISVYARQNDQTVSRKTVLIHRLNDKDIDKDISSSKGEKRGKVETKKKRNSR